MDGCSTKIFPRLGSAILFLALAGSTLADSSDPIGVLLLRQVDSSLNGTGVYIAQPEAVDPIWEVNPAAVGQSVSLFTYFTTNGATATTFPNAIGNESAHADTVGGIFYGLPAGIAPGVFHVDNYEAGYFYSSSISGHTAIASKVINQSFIFDPVTIPEQQQVDLNYDAVAAQNNIFFASGAGNGGNVAPPSTCYNGLSVAAYGGSSSIGPTPDNGRSKPDITAPAQATSFSTPQVAGAATILVQAGARGDGGGGTASAATDIRTVKALLLNGAIKPADWTHTSSAPLDTRYGAGVLNVFNSWKQLAAGKYVFNETTSVVVGDPHPPGPATNNIASSVGWDFNSISSSVLVDKINHYYVEVSTARTFVLTATLVWNRQSGRSSINNLNLFLYATADGRLVASSTSTVDNVEHIYVPDLPPGRYDLQVWKKGGTAVSNSETYALAFEIFAMPLAISLGGNDLALHWPIAPTGFVLESATNLIAPVAWTNVANPVVVSNGQNWVSIPAPAPAVYFRLRRP